MPHYAAAPFKAPSPPLLQRRLRLAIHGLAGSLTDSANDNRSLGAVVKPGKRKAVGRRAANGHHRRANVRADLGKGVNGICGDRSDEQQTQNLDHEWLLLNSRGEA